MHAQLPTMPCIHCDSLTTPTLRAGPTPSTGYADCSVCHRPIKLVALAMLRQDEPTEAPIDGESLEQDGL
jgi:hypothetical protein